ncbi:hypothetical protein CISG_02095 [Coccidioides immitis RMSCC 3703]|uniref:Uncharacterized protein n=2 Tax=Coccidioides immitis TaxID=5501 RepID=A0A0J8U0C3_COCIT|nr:hypothetical protein CIRG_07717 [Coccidioides immitis RMSCC 2394]KMU79677.1 hypothetical protein CISG_02095 [Coccidioides immitis RMSCC 3703]
MACERSTLQFSSRERERARDAEKATLSKCRAYVWGEIYGTATTHSARMDRVDTPSHKQNSEQKALEKQTRTSMHSEGIKERWDGDVREKEEERMEDEGG